MMTSRENDLYISADNTLIQYLLIKSFKILGKRAFMFAAPRLWNPLPHDIR